MRGIDKATGQVVALIALMVLLGAAVRGYLPRAGRPAPDQQTSPASLVFIVALVGGALAVIGFSLIVRLRQQRAAPGNLTGLSEGVVGTSGRPRWRVLAIGLAVLIGWLLSVWLLSRMVGQHFISQRVPVPGSATQTPIPGHGERAPEPTTHAPHSQAHPPGALLGYLTASLVAMLLLIAVGAVVGARRRFGRFGRFGRTAPPEPQARSDRPEPDVAATGQDSLVRAAELGLAQIGDRARGPREAIIACYAVMERELAHVPDAAPQAFDTPTEVLARAVQHHALQAGNAARLVEMFTEARFSAHVMNEGHRQAAVQVLELVLTELSGVAV